MFEEFKILIRMNFFRLAKNVRDILFIWNVVISKLFRCCTWEKKFRRVFIFKTYFLLFIFLCEHLAEMNSSLSVFMERDVLQRFLKTKIPFMIEWVRDNNKIVLSTLHMRKDIFNRKFKNNFQTSPYAMCLHLMIKI